MPPVLPPSGALILAHAWPCVSAFHAAASLRIGAGLPPARQARPGLPDFRSHPGRARRSVPLAVTDCIGRRLRPEALFVPIPLCEARSDSVGRVIGSVLAAPAGNNWRRPRVLPSHDWAASPPRRGSCCPRGRHGLVLCETGWALPQPVDRSLPDTL